MVKIKNNKKKSKGKQALVQPAKRAAPAYMPFADVGGLVGSMFGPLGSNIGRWLGSGVGQIFGSGDYALGGSPGYNILYNSNQAPQFVTGKRSNMVCHREYIGDITGSTGFSVTSYPINPGQSVVFPWLATVAQAYERYKIHGLVFEFRSTSSEYNTSTASLGSVILATDYNAANPAFTSKQIMENFEGAMSCKPSVNMMHGVECKRTATTDELYVRTGGVPSGLDARLYDLGQLEIATQGMSSAYVIGELWATYCVEFITPHMDDQPGGNVLSQHIVRSGFTASAPLGATAVQVSGNMSVTASSTALTFATPVGVQYQVTLFWVATNAVSAVAPVLSYVGATAKGYFCSTSGPDLNSVINNGGTTTNVLISTVIIVSTAASITINAGVLGTLPTSNTYIDIVITQVDGSVTD